MDTPVCARCTTLPATTSHAWCRSCLIGEDRPRCKCQRLLHRGVCPHCDGIQGGGPCPCLDCKATTDAIHRLDHGITAEADT